MSELIRLDEKACPQCGEEMLPEITYHPPDVKWVCLDCDEKGKDDDAIF